MASKRTKPAPSAADELDELFEGITDLSATKKPVKSKPSAAKGKSDADEQDILAELENELDEKAPSRPHTPRVREAAIKRTSTNTPPPPADVPNVPRKSADSTRSYHASFTPSATSSELQESERKVPAEQPQQTAAGGGGWWGGLLSTATAAIKQAEATVKEIQQNEEAKKWADQVRGINVGALRGLGMSAPSHISPLHIQPPLNQPYSDLLPRQATNSAIAPSQPLPTSYTLLLLPSRPTSVFSSISPMTWSVTRPSTRSSTACSVVSWHRSRAVISSWYSADKSRPSAALAPRSNPLLSSRAVSQQPVGMTARGGDRLIPLGIWA